MALPVENNQRFSLSSTLPTVVNASTLLDVVTGIRIVIMNVKVTCLVSSNQSVYVGGNNGFIKAISLGPSFPLHGESSLQLVEGLRLEDGEDLVIKASAPGPSFHVVVEGYFLKKKS